MSALGRKQNHLHGVRVDASPPRVFILPILALALLLRIVMTLSMAKGDPNLWFYHQASELGCIAHSLNTGHGFASPFCGVTGPSAFLAPGYPLLVAAVFRLFGESSGASTAVLLASQTVFGLLIVLALVSLTRRIFGTQAANITGTLCAISPTMAWLPVLFWETSLSILFLTSSLLLALRCVDRPTPPNWARFGLLCALAMLVNPALMLTLAAVFVWALWRNGAAKGPLTVPLLAATVWVLLFAVWPVRNQLVLHSFIPLRSNLGYEMWQGNRPGSDGSFSPELHPNVNRVERSHYAQVGEVAYMREKTALAKAAIQADPARFARLSVQRFFLFWTGARLRKSSPYLIASLSFTTILGLAGLMLLARRQPAYAVLLAIPFVLFPLPYYITHADFRFRLLLDPLAMMLGIYALQCWYRQFAMRRVPEMRAIAIPA